MTVIQGQGRGRQWPDKKSVCITHNVGLYDLVDCSGAFWVCHLLRWLFYR